MDRGWIEDGSRLDRGWIEDGSRMDRGWIEDGSVGWLAEQPPTPPSPTPSPGKKSHRDGPRKEDYPWFRWGWTAGHVSRGDSTVIVSMSLWVGF